MDQIPRKRAWTIVAGHPQYQRDKHNIVIPKSEVPFDRHKDVTYAQIVVAYKPDKLEKNHSSATVGGDRLTVLIDCSAPTADLPNIKCLWNSVLSTPGAKYFTMGVSNFYLGSPMKRPEFMRMPIKIIPQDIIDQYNLLDIVNDGCVYIRIERGMYGLPQSGKLANDLLVEQLRTTGYFPYQPRQDFGNMCGDQSH